MTIKQNGGIFGRNPTFNDIETDGTITSSGDIIANSKVRIEAATNIALQMLDTDGGFPASYLLVENGGRDLSIFAPQDIIFDQDGAETARFRDGGGLCFNGDTAAANALDDYEEGTHTTTATPATSGTITLESSFNGDQILYTKIGQRVYCSAGLRINSLSSPVGSNFSITLPFSVASGSLEMRASGTIYDLGNSNLVGVLVSQGSSTADVLIDPSTLVTGNGGVLYLSINYIGA